MNLKEQLALKLTEARKAYEDGKIEEGDKLKAEAESLQKAIKSMADLDGIESNAKSVLRPTLPGVGAGADAGQKAADAKAADGETLKAVYTMRFGEESAIKQAVMGDLLGKNYRQTVWDQNAAFTKYLRFGETSLEREEYKALKSQIFAFEDIDKMVKSGYDVSTIKATMVEAQGTLGGFAVPTLLQSEIIRRLPGLTAVRGAGATVINLTTGNATDILEITGGNSRYTGALRGSWGAETQSPTEKNLTLGMKTLNADIYTYKVPMSQSLVEDAANLVQLLQDEATTAMAIDEDAAFLVGSGAGQPMGILPGSANVLALTEVLTGSSGVITADGLFGVRRGINSQYRKSAVWVGNSATFGLIEKLKDSQNRYLFDIQKADVSLSDDMMLLRRRVFESEALPDVATGTFPLIFGDMSGYSIVERSGMTIMRFQDSATGINKVEYHFRRRIGGRVTAPWKFAVQKVS